MPTSLTALRLTVRPDRRVPQRPPQDLPTRGLRQLLEHRDLGGSLVGGEALTAEIDEVIGLDLVPPWRLTKATTVSPRYRSGRPTTAASRTAGWS
jgi:hypothetical protein